MRTGSFFLLLVRIYSAVYFKRHVVHIVRHTFSGLKHHFSFANFQLAPRCAEVSFLLRNSCSREKKKEKEINARVSVSRV